MGQPGSLLIAACAACECALASVSADPDKAEIRLSIDGIALDRSSGKGQILAAAPNGPVLFMLAVELRRIELRVSVD